MKDTASSFITLCFCICISVLSVFQIVYSFKSAKLNDKAHVVFKDYSTNIEYLNGNSFELSGSNKKSSITKTFNITNNSSEIIYADVLWNALDLSGSINSFTYEINGVSKNGSSNPSSNSTNVPSTTSEGILMGQRIEVGDSVTYTIKILPTVDSLADDHLYATIGVNIRKK